MYKRRYDGGGDERDARAITDRLSGSNPSSATHPCRCMRVSYYREYRVVFFFFSDYLQTIFGYY